MSEKLTVKGLIQVAHRHAAAWAEKNTTELAAQNRVESVLNAKRDEVILSILGMKKSGWGEKIEFDYTNGRISPLSQCLGLQLEEAAKKWVLANITKVPDLEKESLLQLQNQYLEQYRSILLTKLREHAERQATIDVAAVFSTIGYDPDGVVTLLADLVEKPAEQPIAQQLSFRKQGVLKEVRIHGVVTVIDGIITTKDMDIPGCKVYYLATIYGAWNAASYATIITDGETWQPVTPELSLNTIVLNDLEEYLTRYGARVADSFAFKHETLFMLMNDTDAQLISAAIMTFVREHGGNT